MIADPGDEEDAVASLFLPDAYDAFEEWITSQALLLNTAFIAGGDYYGNLRDAFLAGYQLGAAF